MSLQRNSKLISKKFVAYLIPSILMIFAMQFGSLLDGIIIGNFIGTDALGATSLVAPILYIIQIPGFALGAGGSIVIANRLGKRDIEGSKKVFSFSIILGLGISLLFAGLSFFVSKPLASLFGEASLEYSYPYVFMYLLTDPVIALALLFGSFLAVDNSPKLSSALYIIGNVFKVGFEILFIQVFQWGMYGAALSTGAGYLVGLLTLVFYVRSKKRLLSFTFRLKGVAVKETLKASSTSALNLALTAVQMLVVNIFIGRLITDPIGLFAYGLMANMVFAFDLFAGGPLNLIPTLCGIFYGEKDVYSLKSITRKIYWINIGITLAIMAFILITPSTYAIIFGYSPTGDFDYLAKLVRIYVLGFLFYEVNKFSMNYYPSIEKDLVSLIVVFLRELIIIVPAALLLLFFFGVEGYAWSNLISEAATVLISYGFILLYNKKQGTHGVFMFEKSDPQSFDVSLNDKIENAAAVSEQLSSFALGIGVGNRESQIVALAAEEIVGNIVTYGYKKGGHNFIDVNLKRVGDTLLLRVRDDGMPFDPTKYEYDNDESYSTSGILLIKSLADKMAYMRVFNMNNTTIEINCKGEVQNGNQD